MEIRWVEISPSADTVLVPDTVRVTDRIQLVATAYGMGSKVLKVDKFVWTSLDTSIARVDTSGIVTPRRVGVVEITASATRVGHATVVILPATNRVVITPGVDTIFVDDPAIGPADTTRLRAQAIDSSGTAVGGVRYSWVTSTNNVVAVDSAGRVRAIAIGTGRITASASGGQAAATVEVMSIVRNVTAAAPVTKLLDGDTVQLTASAFGYLGQPLPRTYVWRSSNPAIATVDSAGRAVFAAAGAATFTATTGYRSGSVEVMSVVRNVTVAAPVTQLLDGDTVQLTASAFGNLGQPLLRTYIWTSSNPAVATVDSSGRAVFAAVGAATFTATTGYRSGSVAITALPRKLVSVAAGRDFTCGVANLGRSYCWGRGTAGQLGSPADSTCFPDLDDVSIKPACAIAPKRLSLPELRLSLVSAGDSTACGISAQQMLYCWGNDTFGQVGNGGVVGTFATPTLATVGAERFTKLSVGSAHACALNLGGFAYCWGKDSSGQLGDARRVNSTTPIPVVGPNGQVASRLSFIDIDAGGAHSCGIQQGGRAYCWGNGKFGATGIGNADTVDFPFAVISAESFKQISAGGRHSCAVTTAGSLYCWGDNSSGQLGLPGGSSNRPLLIVSGGYQSVSAGDDFTCALTSGGVVQCWGGNGWGQLGRGESQPSGTSADPRPIATARAFVSVTAGRRHACAVATDGDTWCWGSNVLGALGNSLQAAVRSTPELIARLR